MKPNRLFAMVALVTLVTTAMAEVKPLKATSTLKKVTLFRSQAMIVREVVVPNGTGELAVEVENLPPSVQPSSLFASSKDLKIRSVRYLTEIDPVKLPKDEIQKHELAIKEVSVAQQILRTKQRLLAAKKAYLDRIEAQYVTKLGTTTTTVDKAAKTTGFDFETIAKMTEFVFKQREELTEKELALDAEARALDKKTKDNQTALNALRHGNPAGILQQRIQSAKMRRKAIVYIAKKGAGKASLSLSYLVNSAGWSPAYNMRMTNKADTLNLEYLAHVRQTTGEDWSGVKLVLSTATPNMNAEIPILAPMWIHLTASERKKAKANRSLDYNPLAANKLAQMGSLSKFQKKATNNNYFQGNFALNEHAWNRQQLEFKNGKEAIRRWNEGVRKLVQQMAVEYVIPDSVTLASRNDNQMVQIFSETIACSLFYEAVPLLANYVSRGVEAKNTINQPLLAGQYSAFLDGQYVGSGNVPVTATGQTLILGFGIDPQLRCRRELSDKLGDKSWGSRTETYKYKLVIDNYKSKPVKIRLMDRIPVTKDKGLKITLIDGLLKLSEDADFRALDYPKGVLRWDIELPASTSGSKATTFDYSFDMTFDSDMQVSGLGTEIKAQLRNDLMEMESRRKRK